MSGGGKIAALVAKLEAVASPRFRYELSRKLADEAQRQYRADYAKQQDPYGATWPRGKKTAGKTNIESGYMRASGEPESVHENGFRFKVYAPYSVFRQYGTRYAPAAMIVPLGNRGLGKWGEPFNRVAAAAIRGLFK